MGLSADLYSAAEQFSVTEVREMNHGVRIPRLAATAAVLALALASAVACTADKPKPAPRPTVDRNTIIAAELGERLTITATVVQRLGTASFVVQDVDLPDDGLLIIAATAVETWPPVLVTVRGTVRTFHYLDHTHRGLGARPLYGPFEGRRAVMADSVTVWGRPAPSTGGSAPVEAEEVTARRHASPPVPDGTES